MSKPILLLDFDNTLTDNRGVDVHLGQVGPLLPGARAAVKALQRTFNVKLFTTRPHTQFLRCVLGQNGLSDLPVVCEKVSGLIVDDSCLTFPGKWDTDFVDRIESFKPWYKP